ncbi:MAG: flagellar hook-basal body complex protein [Rhodospirillales bacterium]|nr:flagellar hook-basal body complex protein [Rhodospirillales bacterium]
MENISTVALSRMVAQSRALDVIATNLANADTPGFRAGRTLFTAWFARQPGGAEPPGGAPVSYVQDRATYRDTAPGALKATGNPLDLAIGDAQGWFTVNTPRGPRLTRAGQFQLDASGIVVDAEGYPLLDVNGNPLQTRPTDTHLTVTADGTLASENGPIGRIGVVMPDTERHLMAQGNSLFATTGPTTPVANPALVQGAIEQSNVQPVLEVTRMMQSLRDFQLTSQMVQEESTRQSDAINKILNHTVQG